MERLARNRAKPKHFGHSPVVRCKRIYVPICEAGVRFFHEHFADRLALANHANRGWTTGPDRPPLRKRRTCRARDGSGKLAEVYPAATLLALGKSVNLEDLHHSTLDAEPAS